jgi:hypothetical protein
MPCSTKRNQTTSTTLARTTLKVLGVWLSSKAFIPDLPAEYDRMPLDYDAAKSDVVRCVAKVRVERGWAIY